MLIIPLWRVRHPRSLQNADRIFRPGFCTTNAHGGGGGGGVDPDEKWKRELNRWEKVSTAISEVHYKKGSIFQLSVVKKFPYLRRSGDEEMTGKISASWENSEQ
jgi:hypothetical protein